MSCLKRLFRATNLVGSTRYMLNACGSQRFQMTSRILSNSYNMTTCRRFLSSTGGSNVINGSKGADKKNIKLPVDIPPSERIETVPNETWSQETLDLYHKLQDLVDNSNGEWVKHYTWKKTDARERFFTFCVDEKGKLFEYCVIYNGNKGAVKAVCQFGPYTKGLNMFVNGGAMAVVLDILTTLAPIISGHPAMTANLSVNFKNPLPIDSTVSVDCWIASVESKKVFVEGEMKSPDGSKTYATVKTLCIKV